MSRQRNGFTLIELLIVVAIIMILAMALFPVFAKARERAIQATCASNLKQTGVGFAMYLQDNDQRYPLSYFNSIVPGYNNGSLPNWPSVTGWYGWRRCLNQYVKSIDVLYCPMLKKTKDHWQWYTTEVAAQRGWFEHVNGYAANGYIIGPGNSVSSGSIRSASSLLLVGEMRMGRWHEINIEWIKYATKGIPEAAIGYHHNGGQNQLLADYHVRFARMKQIVDEYPNDSRYNGSYLPGGFKVAGGP